jgi:hypothetical protein
MAEGQLFKPLSVRCSLGTCVGQLAQNVDLVDDVQYEGFEFRKHEFWRVMALCC